MSDDYITLQNCSTGENSKITFSETSIRLEDSNVPETLAVDNFVTSNQAIEPTDTVETANETEKSPTKPQMPDRLRKRLEAAKSTSKPSKTKEQLECEQKNAEARREKIRLEAEKRREMLKEKTERIMRGFEFIEKQNLLKRGVEIPNVERASRSELCKTYQEVNADINLLNANLNKQLKRSIAEADALTKL